VQRWDGAEFSLETDELADESIVQLALNGSVLSTVLATNRDLDALAVGHLACEHGPNIVGDIENVECNLSDGIHHVAVTTNNGLVIKPRPGLITTSCGACEASERTRLVHVVERVDDLPQTIDLAELLEAMPRLTEHQPLFSKTGGVHAAGLLYSFEAEDGLLREDIGRHNAVDKVVGAHLLSARYDRPMVLTLSGRCGWDIVAKAARMNIPIIASIGAASHLAAETARACGITLVTFGRQGKGTVIGPVQGRFQGKD